MNAKIICLFAVAPFVSALPLAAFALSPNSQLRQIAELNTKEPNEDVIWIDADINGDGWSDLLVTTGSNRSDEDARDFEWQIYSGNADGSYTRARNSDNGQSLISMRLERCWIGQLPELKKHGLLHLVSGNGGQAKCQFKAVILAGGSFTEVPIGEPVSAEENFEIYNKRIQSKGHPTTSKATVAQVRQLQSATQVSPKATITPRTDSIAMPPSILPQPAPKKAPESKHTLPGPSEEPASSTPWSIIILLIVAAFGLLWLLIKNRK